MTTDDQHRLAAVHDHGMRHILPASASLVLVTCLGAAELVNTVARTPTEDDFVQAWGVNAAQARSRFARDGFLEITQIGGTAGANVVYQGETVSLTIQLSNQGGKPIHLAGRWVLVGYSMITPTRDVFKVALTKGAEYPAGELTIDLAKGGFADVEVPVPLPETFGAYALLLERPDAPRLFAAGLVRTMRPGIAPGQQFYQVCMDIDNPEAIRRLATAPNRIDVPYVPSDHPEYAASLDRLRQRLLGIKATGFPVIAEFGGGPSEGPHLPLGRGRPHLDEQDTLRDGKQDLVWLPSYDADFKAFAKSLALEFGWPKGPINAMKLWNEPWNGLSISGWGADDQRYREIYGTLCEAVEEVRAEAGIGILLGAADSSSNTFDKLFADGGTAWLDRLDFMSLHYQGMTPSNPRFMRDRKHALGRTRFWDTESWVAQSPDRVPVALSAMLAAGHDRIVGIQSNGVVATPSTVTVRTAKGSEKRQIIHAWPVAAAQVAFNALVGNRTFRDLVFGEGLPYAFRFAGDEAEDCTVVLTGDLAPTFESNNTVGITPLRSARSLTGLREEEGLRAQLAALPAGHADRLKLQQQLDQLRPISGARLLLPAGSWVVRDGLGNPQAPSAGMHSVPLDGSGYFLRADGTPGSTAAMLAALRSARIEGYEPIATVVRDATTAIAPGAVFRIETTNVLNRPVEGTLAVTVSGLRVEHPPRLALPAHGKAVVEIRVVGGTVEGRNLYDLDFRLDAGADGVATHHEQVRANVIHRRSITIDGDLADWAGAIGQPVIGTAGGATLMESAWLPMESPTAVAGKGQATAWLAADERGFAFAARIADDTPDAGMPRFADRDEDAAYYPAIAYEVDKARNLTTRTKPYRNKHAIAVAPAKAFWEPVGAAMQLELDLPEERLVSLYVVDDDLLWVARPFRLDLRVDGKPVGKAFVKEAEGVWLRLRLKGKCSLLITAAGHPWQRTSLAAVAVDPLPADAAAGPVLGEDRETKQLFQGRYGTELLLLPDQPAVGSTVHRWADTVARKELRWPPVRRFSYRMKPELPNGAAPNHDNVQLAFNILPDGAKPWYPAAPGTFPGFAGRLCSDYEFALNPVAEAYGGGYEVWPLRAVGSPDKHFYPRQPKAPGEGPVAGTELVVRRDGASRVVEARIPWAAIPEVRAAWNAGQPVKLSYRINDNAGVGCMELAYGRSASRRGSAFKPDWAEHWENQIEFGWEGR